MARSQDSRNAETSPVQRGKDSLGGGLPALAGGGEERMSLTNL